MPAVPVVTGGRVGRRRQPCRGRGVGDPGRHRAAAGLGGLGKPAGYVRRQVEGWTERYHGSRTDELPVVLEVAAWLAAHQPGDGARFHGRGFVQLTGRYNYDRAGKFFKVDLIGNPERAKDPELAYEIAMEGMTKGWFTGAKLAKFFKPGAPPNYEDARTIINGHDKAQTIADLARRFDELLAAALA